MRCRRAHRAFAQHRFLVGHYRSVGQITINVACQFQRGGIALVRVQRHGFQADGFECFRHALADLGRAFELTTHDLAFDFVHARGGKRKFTGEDLVQRHAQAVDIAGGAQFHTSLCLFRAHVSRCSRAAAFVARGVAAGTRGQGLFAGLFEHTFAPTGIANPQSMTIVSP